ncbi:MAG: DUF6273 domain-containing protein [Eubacterium sp.]|nr:DUF6273 domain-containing protein [Eubacterium sp.]
MKKTDHMQDRKSRKRWKTWLAATLTAILIVPSVSALKAEAADGTWGENEKGIYFVYSDGRVPKNEWVQDGKKWYYMNSWGYITTSWKAIDGKYYFFNAKGVMQTKWKQIGSKWYYFGTNGAMVTGWKKIGQSWYLFDTNGVMQTGWKQIGAKQYYLGTDGAMATGTVVIAGKTYTFDSNGVLESGSTDLSGAKVGDVVSFGSYEQDNITSDGAEAIEWIVLDKFSDGSLFLVSRFGLDAMPYNSKLGPMTWDKSTIRSWLNSTFYNTAFTSAQKTKIKTTTVVNDDNFFWGTRGGSNTKDKVFLLSDTEAKKYFVDLDGRYAGGDSSARACKLTAYAIAHGGEEKYSDQWWSQNCWYWLRSPGQYSNYAAYVYRNGYVSYDYDGIDYMTGIVRPAIVVNP